MKFRARRNKSDEESKKRTEIYVERTDDSYFVGLLVFVLMLVFIVNTGFLGRYYMSHKQKDLIEMYEEMSEAVNNGNLGNEAVQKKLVAELEKRILMSARWIFLTMERLYLQM